jgi:CheY-like chemotaxis protein
VLFNLLLVEDNPHKRSSIVEYIYSLGLDINVSEVGSFNSASRALSKAEYAAVLLDMTLPTFDKTDISPSGNFRPFGGAELARRIVRKHPNVPIIFITQYKSFSDNIRSYSFDDLREELTKECGNHMRGMIYFDNAKSSWKEELGKLLHEVVYENTNR